MKNELPVFFKHLWKHYWDAPSGAPACSPFIIIRQILITFGNISSCGWQIFWFFEEILTLIIVCFSSDQSILIFSYELQSLLIPQSLICSIRAFGAVNAFANSPSCELWNWWLIRFIWFTEPFCIWNIPGIKAGIDTSKKKYKYNSCPTSLKFANPQIKYFAVLLFMSN